MSLTSSNSPFRWKWEVRFAGSLQSKFAGSRASPELVDSVTLHGSLL